ncbi:ribonuclease H-like domain-containing protein [Tanacetum coccineum]
MSPNDKLGCRVEIQSNERVQSYEEEMEYYVFKCSKEDSIGKPSYSRFTKTNDFKGVPPPLSGDYTPQPQEEIDDSNLNHLIKDCDYYEKKIAREAEVKRVVNTGNGVTKPVWTNANRTNISSGRPKVNIVSYKVNSVRPTSNSISPKRPQMNQINQRRDFSTSYSSVRRPFAKSTAQMTHTNAVMGSWGSAVKTSASYNWRDTRPNFNYNSGPIFIRTEHPLKNMVDRGIFDSGCSGHMTGNKDQLEDFEEFNGGSVTFGGSKGYISSKDFNMPDENQILLKVPRHHNMYSFDMKTPSPAKGFACLIAKATSDESKLWHRRLRDISKLKNLNKLGEGNLIENNLVLELRSQSDNGTEFKNRDMLKFCGNKGIKQEYSNARTPQQNGVAERMNRTLIEAARTMLADSLLQHLLG